MSNKCTEIMETIRQQDAVDNADLMILVDEIERLQTAMDGDLFHRCEECGGEQQEQEDGWHCPLCEARAACAAYRLFIINDMSWHDFRAEMLEGYISPDGPTSVSGENALKLRNWLAAHGDPGIETLQEIERLREFVQRVADGELELDCVIQDNAKTVLEDTREAATQHRRAESMSDIGDLYRELRKERQQAGAARSAQAASDYEAAVHAALQGGWSIMQYGDQYNLSGPNGELYQLYPSNQRVYRPKGKHGLFLRLPKPWTLLDAVAAAIGGQSQ